MTGRGAVTAAPGHPVHSARAGASLLEQLQGVIERTYRMSTGIEDVGRFILGDHGYRRVYGGVPTIEKVEKVLASGGGDPGPRLLLRAEGEGFRAAIYYPDRLVRSLEAHPPTRGLSEANIDAFASFVEELDHLLCVASRLREQRAFTLLELELHANVTKYLVAELFLEAAQRARAARRPRPAGNRLAEAQRAWLRWHLFDKIEYADPDAEIRARYRDAARYAWRFLARIAGFAPQTRLAALREFHRRTHHQNLAALA